MTLPGMLRFEWRYQTRRIIYLGLAVLSGGIAAFLIGTGFGDEAVRLNAPATVMQAFGLISLWGVLVQTIASVQAALRDEEHRMAELVLASPVADSTLLMARFGGALLAGTGVFLVFAVVLATAPFLLADPERVGPFRLLPYVWALVSLLLPNLVLITALLFGVARFTRSTLATYVGGIAIYGVYLVTAMLVDSPLIAGSAPPTPERLARAALLDPFGLSAFFEQTRYWTPAEKDVQLLRLEGHYLLNRVVWLAVGVMVLLAVARLAPFRTRRRRMPARLPEPEPAPAMRPEPAGPLPPLSPRPAFWPALRSTIRLDLRHLFGSRAFRALLVFWCFVATLEAVTALRAGEYATRILASSGQLAGALTLPLGLMGTLFLVYFGAEVVWRERAAGIDPLIDATPAATSVFVVSKLVTLGAIPMVLGVSGFGAAGLLQLVSHGLPVEPAVFLGHLWFAGMPLVLLAAGVVFLQVATGNRWAGMVAGLLMAIGSRSVRLPGLSHPLFRFAAGPAVSYSDLDGFGPAPASFAAFMGYWGLLAIVLAVLAERLWPRGATLGLGTRFRRGLGTWRGSGRRLALVAATGFVAGGAWLFDRTVVVHRWESPAAQVGWRVGYEQAYRRLQRLPQPSIVAVQVAVDFVPERRSASIRGTLRLVNRTGRLIDSVWITTRRDLDSADVAIEGARLAGFDARYGVWHFAPDRPLADGDSLRVEYRLTVDRSGIRAGGFDQDVAGNGSYLTSDIVLPSLGYRATYELSDRAERRKRGLPPPTFETGSGLAADSLVELTHRRGASPAWFTLRATLSTAPGQTALGPGRLARSWTAMGRPHFEYVVDTPATPRFAFASGRFAVERAWSGGIPIELWYDPRHARNAGRMAAVARQALDVLAPRFGPYPHTGLRMVEVPAGWPFAALAMSGMIFFSEDRGMLADPRPQDVDLLTRRVAHEVAHQWWGHAVDPVDLPGATIIVETLAKYAEQRVVAAVHGEGALPAILAFDHDRYLAGRASDREPEPPLLGTTVQDYLFYGKGAIAMHALHDELGDSAMTRALGMLRHREEGPFGAATAAELQSLLRAEAGTPRARALVDEWFGERIVYDLRVDSARVDSVPGGYRLRAVMSAGRLGPRAEAVPLDGEDVDVAVEGGGPEGTRLLYARAMEVVRGSLTLQLELGPGERPVAVVIDPLIRRIDRERSNNRRTVTVGEGLPAARQ